MDECDQYIGEQIAATIRRLIRRLAEQMKKHIFHLAWSPSACAIETAIKPLIDMVGFREKIFNQILSFLLFLHFLKNYQS